ncbi:hypothetical protein HYS54_04085 [Candidatus Micrarchaeota archaeon]|nr:hypothetical protein [Candidatus Micrarchaeota archaeon]
MPAIDLHRQAYFIGALTCGFFAIALLLLVSFFPGSNLPPISYGPSEGNNYGEIGFANVTLWVVTWLYWAAHAVNLSRHRREPQSNAAAVPIGRTASYGAATIGAVCFVAILLNRSLYWYAVQRLSPYPSPEAMGTLGLENALLVFFFVLYLINVHNYVTS